MFVYECKTHGKDCLVLFLGQYNEKSRKSIPSSIQRAYENHLTPEVVFFVFPFYIKDDVLRLLKAVQTDLTRHKHSPVIFLSFNVSGEFNVEGEFNDLNCNIPKIDCSLIASDIVEYGFKHLMDQRHDDVLVKSPAGTTFVKPSGKELEEFIYASQLARNSFEHQFLAMALLKHAPDPTEIDVIHIDTASIASIAEAVVYYISKFEGANCKHITYRSFSSYKGLEDNPKPDNVSGAWVIISASASLSMGTKIVTDWNIKPEQVVTILSYGPLLSEDDDNTGNNVVFCLESYSKIDKKSFSPTKVQVQGESFAVEVSKPQKILFRKNHYPRFIKDNIYPFHNDKTFNLNRERKLLHVSYNNLRKKFSNKTGELNPDRELYLWITQIVKWLIPRNLSTIIVSNKPEDQKFLKDFQSVLKHCDFNLDDIEVIDFAQQELMEKVCSNSVLVLSAAITTGRIFVDTNRALRLANHKGMRIFATAYVTASSQDEFKKVSNGIKKGTNNFNYAFLHFKKIHIGPRNISSWHKESEVVRDLVNSDENEVTDYWQNRKQLLEKTGEGLQDAVGLHYDSNSEKFKLTPDFIFWPKGYEKSDKISMPAVYATVSSVLQYAREKEINGFRLSSNIYQHCVIDPENFIRFNDSILQSCLWRCALPGELDYRRSDALSKDVQGIMDKLFQSSDSERGVTSLDLLMGLAIRWIKISNESMQLVLKSADEHLKAPHAKLLIQYMKCEFKL